MRSVLGIVLFGAGIAMAVLWMPAYDGERQLAVVTEIAMQGIARVSVPEPAPTPADLARTSRTFSPQTPLITEQRVKTETAATAAPRASSAVVRAAGNAAANLPADMMVTGSVAAAPGAATIATVTSTAALPANPAAIQVTVQAASPPRMTSSRPADETGRIDLIRNLQRELKRVGCYPGEVDGDWGSGSKRAMSAFTERVNATLPFDEPDYILLTLVQGHTAQACGKGCPLGQAMSDGGKCAPNAVIAQSTRRANESAKRPAGREAEPIRTAAVEPPATSIPVSKMNGNWSATVAPAPATIPPAAIPPAAIAAGVALATGALTASAPPAAAAMLPGRMAVGAVRSEYLGPTGQEHPAASDAIRRSIPAESAPPQSGANSAGQQSGQAQDAGDKDRSKARSNTERSRPRQVTYSAPAVSAFRPVVIYREPPRYRPPAAFFAPPPPARRATAQRGWTAHFFERF